jgi:hypothetical protein
VRIVDFNRVQEARPTNVIWLGLARHGSKYLQNLPDDMLFMILARLPLQVLVNLKSVCKQWNYLLSSSMGNPLQIMDPNFPFHSLPGFFVQLNWGHEHDVETWVIEGNGSQIYKVPLHIIVADVSKSLLCSIRVPHAYLSNPIYGDLEMPHPPFS